MAYKIAFYDTKPYDERSFTEANEKFGFDIRYYKGHLNMNNVVLTKGVDVVLYLRKRYGLMPKYPGKWRIMVLNCWL